MITFHDDIIQGTPEWEAARDGKFTGSNADKLLTSFGAGDHARSRTTDFTGNFHTKRGHLLEGEALELYHDITGEVVKTTGYVSNSDMPNCIYSPDGYTDNHLLEVKCFAEGQHLKLYKAHSTRELSLKILAQIHFGMMITGKRKARLIVYNPTLDAKRAFKFIDIDYDPRIEKRFKQILEI